jgi:TniQ
MMTVSRLSPLPCSLDPLPHETLTGFLLRLSCRFECAPSRLSQLCGLSERADRLPKDYLIELPAERATGFEHSSRLTAGEVAGLALRRYAATYPPLASARAGSSRNRLTDHDYWVVSFPARYCPQCLAGDGSPIQQQLGGAWRLPWHLPVIFACTEHARLLESHCPDCGRPQDSPMASRLGLVLHPQLIGLHPAQCRNVNHAVPWNSTRTPPTACAARLYLPHASQTEFEPADTASLLALQQRIDRYIDPLPHPPDHEAPQYLQDLITISKLIKLGWPAASSLCPSTRIADVLDRHAEPITAALRDAQDRPRAEARTRIPQLWTAPQDAAQCAALLMTAQAVVGDGDPQELRSRIQPLAASAAACAPRFTYGLLAEAPMSTGLACALVRYHRGFYAAGQQPGRLRIPQRPRRFTADNVPPLLPAVWFEDHFDGFIDLLESTGKLPQSPALARARITWQLRQAASLKLAELATGASWTHCAAALDIPPASAGKTIEVLRTWMTADLWDRFAQSIEQIAQYLDTQADLPDYTLRRRTPANWRMSPEDWTAARAGPRGCTLERRGADVGTIIAWTSAVQNEHRRCPLLSSLRANGQATAGLAQSVATLYHPAKQAGARLRIRRRLELYGDERGKACDRQR